jgi:hypothetical protein
MIGCLMILESGDLRQYAVYALEIFKSRCMSAIFTHIFGASL